MARGHGTEFPGGSLTAPHAQFLVGLEQHLVAPSNAHLAYKRAALEYRNQGADTLARLASLGSASVTWVVLNDADFAEVRRELDRLAETAPEIAARLRHAAEPYLDVLGRIGSARAGRVLEDSYVESVDIEGARLLERAALSMLDNPVLATRLARLADASHSRVRGERSSLALLADSLCQERRWADAAPLLAELHEVEPGNRDTAAALAYAYVELGRWPEARAVLIGLIGDPPGADDVATLQQLWTLAQVHGGDPEADQWRQAILAVDPAADPVSGMPKPVGAGEPPRLLAAFRDGKMQVHPDWFNLPEQERPAHFAAAIIAGSPDGREQLDRLFEDDPVLAQAVLPLLGLRQLTPEQARVEQHIQAGEAHFGARRFEDAGREYAAALRLDPDHATAAMFLGDTWYRRGAYHLAQAYLEESLAIEPSPQAYRFLGDAIRLGGHGARRARDCYQRALALDPEYRGAREALAQLQRQPPAGGPASSIGPTEPPVSGAISDPTASSAVASPPRPAATSTRGPAVGAHPTGAPSGTRPGGRGDSLVAAILRQQGSDSVVAVMEDDERFTQWLAEAAPDEIVRAIMHTVSIGFQYHMKDRDVPRWKHWVERQVALAQALPSDFGPAQSRLELGRDRLLADALSSLAEVRVVERQLPEARILYERCLELLTAEEAARERAGLAGEAEYDQLFSSTSIRGSVLRHLADVCRLLGDPSAAAQHRAEAERLDGARPTVEAEVEAFIVDADYATSRGMLDDALGRYQHALYLAEDEDPEPLVPRMLTRAINAVGQAYLRLGLHRAALGHFDRARRLNERTGNADRLAHDHLAIGRVLRDRPALAGVDDTGDAREHFERALRYASVPEVDQDDLAWTASDGTRHRISTPDRAWRILLELGQLLQERDDGQAAAHFLTLATRLADLLRASLIDEQQRIVVHNQQIEAFAQLTKVYIRLAKAGGAGAAGYGCAAWLANESMRARSFLDVLGDAQLAVPPDVPLTLVSDEHDLLERRRRLRQAGRSDLSFWEEYREVAADLDAIWEQMRTAAPATEAYVEVRQAKPADPSDLIRLLAEDTGRAVVLATLVRLSNDMLGVLALRSDQAAPIVEARPVDITRLSRFVRHNFGSTGRVRELSIDMEDLFQYELAPVGDLLTAVCDPSELLIVCPVGVLHNVPLGAVRADGRALLERNPLALLPSASLLRALRSAERVDAAAPAAVFGDPTGDLPGARAEALAIADRFAVTPTLGSEVTIDAVRRALTTSSILHVAAHASFDAADPLASGVLLGDGVLAARDIIGFRAPALSLVTLSACETGVSETDAAEELVGLTRALFFAGADAIVVSLWKVPDLATMDIMGAFYDRIGRGMSKIDAIREAVLNARERHGPERLDRWAGFQLVGDWR